MNLRKENLQELKQNFKFRLKLQQNVENQQFLKLDFKR